MILSVFLIYPVINTIILSFKDATGQEFVGLDNYEFVFTDDSMLRSLRNTAGVDHRGPAGGGQHRPRLRHPRRPAASRRGGRQVDDLPADGDLVRRRRRHLPPDLQLPPEGFGTNIGLLNGIRSGLGKEPVRVAVAESRGTTSSSW